MGLHSRSRAYILPRLVAGIKPPSLAGGLRLPLLSRSNYYYIQTVGGLRQNICGHHAWFWKAAATCPRTCSGAA